MDQENSENTEILQLVHDMDFRNKRSESFSRFITTSIKLSPGYVSILHRWDDASESIVHCSSGVNPTMEARPYGRVGGVSNILTGPVIPSSSAGDKETCDLVELGNDACDDIDSSCAFSGIS
jgi:hypothetical protein